MSIKLLSDHVKSMLTSSCRINDYTTCIFELIYNSLDAGSTSIAVRVNVNENRIQVVDNGIGISEENLKQIGHRYMTNKDEASDKYGSKGDALASIIQISHKVEIISRNEDSTWLVVFKNGKRTKFSSAERRASKGTTVEIKGFLYNLAVRKLCLNPTKELKNTKNAIINIALAHNNVSFTLRDDSCYKLLLEVHKTADTLSKIDNIFGHNVSKSLKELSVEKHPYKVSGFIGPKTDETKLSLIYLNRKLVVNSKLNQAFEKMLSNVFPKDRKVISKSKFAFGLEDINESTNEVNYIIFVVCPYNEVDLVQNPKNTNLDFQNWQAIQKLLEKFVNFYKESLPSFRNEAKNNLAVMDVEKKVAEIVRQAFNSSTKRKIGYSQVQNHVKGKTVKRIDKRKPEKCTEKLKKLAKSKNAEDKAISSLKRPSKEEADMLPQKINNVKNISNDVSKDNFSPMGKNRFQMNENITNKVSKKLKKIAQKKILKKLNLNKLFESSNKNVKQRCSEISKGLNNVIVHYKRSNGQRRKIIMYHSVKTTKDPKQSIIKRAGTIVIREFIPFPKITSNDKDRLSKNTKSKKKIIKSNYDLLKTVLNSTRHKRILEESFKEKSVKNSYDSHCCRGTHSKNNMMKVMRNRMIYDNNSKFTRPFNDVQREISKKVQENPKTVKDTSEKIVNLGNSIDISHILSNVVRLQGSQSQDKRKIVTSKILLNISANQIDEINEKLETTSFNNSKYVTTSMHEADRSGIDDIVDVYNSIENEMEIGEIANNSEPNKCSESRKSFETSFTSVSLKTAAKEISVDKKTADCKEIEKTNHALNKNGVETSSGPEFIEDTFVKIDQEHKTIKEKSKLDTYSTYHKSTLGNSIPVVMQDTLNKRNNIIFISDDVNSGTKGRESKLDFTIECSQKRIKNDNSGRVLNNSSDDREIVFISDSSNVSQFDKHDFQNIKNATDNTLDKGLDKDETLTIDSIASQSRNHLEIQRDLVSEIDPKLVSKVNATDLFSVRATVFDIDMSMFKDTFDYIESPILCRNTHKTKKITNIIAGIDNDVTFEMKSRLNFLPKGHSQLFDRNKITKTYNENYDESQNYFTGTIYENFETNIQKGVEIYEPNFQVNIEKFQKRSKKATADLVFDNESLKNIQVIDQVDAKFIAAILPTKYTNDVLQRKYLVLFDQHAVHERIRLERLMKAYKPSSWISVECQPFALTMDIDNLSYLSAYQTKILDLGLCYTVDFEQGCIDILQIPECLYGRYSKKLDEMRIMIKKLIEETLNYLCETNGALNSYPKTLTDIVNMEACRNAIKFGEKLTYDSCVTLLSDLSDCKAAFQCAHGRPCMAVLTAVARAQMDSYKFNPEKLKNFKRL